MKKAIIISILFALVCLIIPAVSMLLPSGETSPANSNYYLVYNHKTQKVMKLAPSDYIKGVVAAEMPLSYNTEALKAQAVAAHTYALKQISENIGNPRDDFNGAYLSTDPSVCQGYLSKDEMKKLWGNNYNKYYKKLSDAVDSVISTVMTYNGEPIAAAFHSISNGATESAENIWGKELAYLVSVESDSDIMADGYETSLSIKTADFVEAIKSKYPDIVFDGDASDYIVIDKISESGTVLSVQVGDKSLTGTELRSILGLKSACFSVTSATDGFLFSVKGYGHGVGMSQNGANFMAEDGSNYKEILSHYYTGITFEEFELQE